MNVDKINEQMLFYVQTLAEQAKIAQKDERAEQMEDDVPAVTMPKEYYDAKRKVMGRIMIDYPQLDLCEPGANYIVYDKLVANPQVLKLAQSELKYVKTSMDTATFVKEIVNSLDQMTFLRRVSDSGEIRYEIDDQTEKFKMFVAKEFRKSKG